MKNFVGLLVVSLLLVSCNQDTTAPEVIDTFPQNGALDVDSSIESIWVQFNEPMMDDNWSWAYEKEENFPSLNGQPYYSEGSTKNILPVQLEPNHEYVIWINSATLQNFKDEAGNPVKPFPLTFKTK